MNNFIQVFWKSVKNLTVNVFTILGTVGCVVAFFFVPEAKIGWKWLILVISISIYIISVFMDMVLFLLRQKVISLPKIINSVSSTALDVAIDPNNPSIILLLGSSSIYGYDVIVSIFYNQKLSTSKENSFERLIGIGHISNIQENGNIQVSVLKIDSGHVDVWNRVRTQDATTLDQLVVKPSTSYSNLRGVPLND